MTPRCTFILPRTDRSVRGKSAHGRWRIIELVEALYCFAGKKSAKPDKLDEGVSPSQRPYGTMARTPGIRFITSVPTRHTAYATKGITVRHRRRLPSRPVSAPA